MILADCVKGPFLLQRSLSLESLETESGANVLTLWKIAAIALRSRYMD